MKNLLKVIEDVENKPIYDDGTSQLYSLIRDDEIHRIKNIVVPKLAIIEKEIDSLLWKLIKIWRLYFIEYTDVGVPIYSAREEKLKSKEEEESELVDEVTKHIEKEIGV